jgi:hypothetical protein
MGVAVDADSKALYEQSSNLRLKHDVGPSVIHIVEVTAVAARCGKFSVCTCPEIAQSRHAYDVRHRCG